MNEALLATLAGAGALAFVIPFGQAAAHSAANTISTAEIARALQGKTCTTKTGATFSFGMKGQYVYDGLWKSDGHYRIHRGFITVALHSGLERSFTVTTKSGILYLENTAVSCAADMVLVGSH